MHKWLMSNTDRQILILQPSECDLKAGQMKRSWMPCSGRSGHRQSRSRSYNCAVWHYISSQFQRRKHTACGHKSTAEPEAGEWRESLRRNKRDGRRYREQRYSERERERGEVLLSKPHPSPAKPPFLPLPLFPCWNLFILGLFLLGELFPRNMMDD